MAGHNIFCCGHYIKKKHKYIKSLKNVEDQAPDLSNKLCSLGRTYLYPTTEDIWKFRRGKVGGQEAQKTSMYSMSG